MVTKQQEALRDRAMVLAEREDQEDARLILSEMAAALDLLAGDPPPREMARQLFETGNMAEYLENLPLLGGVLAHPSKYESLDELRSGLLL